MSRSVRIIQRATRQLGGPVADIPTFLCPGILRYTEIQAREQSTRCDNHHTLVIRAGQRRGTASVAIDWRSGSDVKRIVGLEKLPQQCAGCGAFSQTMDQDGPGFFTLSRGSVRTFLSTGAERAVSKDDEIVRKALELAGAGAEGLKVGGFTKSVKSVEPPVCDRCHKLRHHETGVSIHHPSIQSIQDTILESPFKYNHVYHVLDAADFPMSLVPGLQRLLYLTPQRSKNRRSKTGKFYHGRKTDVSFIITRSDLFAPAKTQVDSMMPYLRAVLRDALGRTDKGARLGNVRCVSAKQAWWTKELKEEIWHRGGGGWMVGKVNVGKSQLFHNVFPKGRRDIEKVTGRPPMASAQILDGLNSLIPEPEFDEDPMGMSSEDIEKTAAMEPDNEFSAEKIVQEAAEETDLEMEHEALNSKSLDTSILLPPAPPEEDYPAMPLVSSLPGTTASPIRLSFGNGKGELIDLPGLSRGDLELHVQPENRHELVMRSRIRPEQQVIKPGKSLLLGGFIRITPTDLDTIIMAYSFTPIKAHLTSTQKAIGTQSETRVSSVQNIALPGTGEKIKSAGIFPLKWDVTRQRTGPITAKTAVGIKPEKLPYRVLATDILIEGCGWVELVAQVRKQPQEVSIIREQEIDPEDNVPFDFGLAPEHEQRDPDWPAVEVFTPQGRFVGARRPMNAWLMASSKPANTKLQGRPRRSMKGMKKLEKTRRRPAA